MSQEPSSISEPPREDSEDRAARWLSRGFETLVDSLEGDPGRTAESIDFDVVIVGTGYGGAVAAAELAATREGRRICVLERGSEHLPGSFPARMAELPGHVRFSTPGAHHPRGRREGLFDLRIGEDLCALVANGVGGGSLINAGVMVLPDKEVFRSAQWPESLRAPAGVDALFEQAEGLRQRLGATQTVQSVNQPEPLKYTALGRIHCAAKVQPLPITAALTDAPDKTFRTAAGIGLDACVRCGNCATGCNYNAKISLDVTLLAQARQHGAELFTGATVLRIERLADASPQPLWQLHVVHTDESLRRRQGGPTLVRARRVVLAAGTFGSTEILLRSRGDTLRLSHKLGHQVSSNGDLIAAAYAGTVAANCVADEDTDPCTVAAAQRIGPTITGMLDLRATDGMLIQDLAVPGALRSVFEQSVTTAAVIHQLAESDKRPHNAQTRDACALDGAALRNTQLVAIIGHDGADGVMKLNASDDWDCGDGAATVQWPTLKDYPPLLQRHRRFEQLLKQSGTGARALANPMWRLLPEQLGDLLGSGTGPLLTVHPLGGCPMGDDASSGVVDHCGRVFDAAAQRTGQLHEGLVVLDGSIVPASLGINPALTIASLALRAIGQLRAEWGYVTPGIGVAIGDRPRFARPGPVEPANETLVEVIERLSGPLALRGMQSGDCPAHVELTMRFDPISIAQLTSGTAAAKLQLQAPHGQLRIFAARPRDDVEAPDDEALLVATVRGNLRAFRHQPSSPMGRRLRGIWAWLRNRGLKDSVFWMMDRWAGEGPPPANDHGLLQEVSSRLQRLWALGSHAGAVRLLEYDLRIEDIVKRKVPAELAQSFRGAAIKGEKQLTYSRRGNPWRQLMEVSLKSFPRARTAGAVLTLDMGYLARQRVPLLRVVRQQDHAKALADVAALGLYVVRMLIQIHAWSFRLPDAPRPREIERLPGYVPGLPPPEIHEFPVDGPRNGAPVTVRLTRYRYSKSRRSQAIGASPAAREAIETPILLIHGYSTSGTAFVHHAVRPNVVSALWERGRDVWVADLRTSSGMPHARVAWTFEQVGMADIPVAVHQVCVLTGAAQIDVFAHCMGSAMLGMALLGSQSRFERFPQLRRELPDRIRRLVMSQVAPAVVFTPANVFRAYAMQYLKYLLPPGDYEFRPSGVPSAADRMIDRVLATLPYPQEEFDFENPFWPPWRRTPWAGTRHRMDALYGRDFNVSKLPAKVLGFIDDHFGPLSIDTVSQAIHFARLRSITDRQGFNDYVRPDRLSDKLRFPILYVHGRDNGLVSRQTASHFHDALKDSDPRFESPRAFLPKLYDAGHQDLLIGTPAAAMMSDVNAYLECPFPGPGTLQPQPRVAFTARVPSYGVRVPSPLSPAERCSLGDECASGTPLAVVLIPVVQKDGRYLPAEPGALARDRIAQAIEWRAVAPVAPGQMRTRYTFELAGCRSPDGACGILVLLLCSQSGGIRAPQTGGHPIHDLATHVASKGQNGKGLASLARIAAGANGSVRVSIGALVKAMARAVEHAFRENDAAELGLGILRPPRRGDPSEPPPPVRSFALASCHYPGSLLDRTPPCATGDGPAGPSDASYLRLLAWLEGGRCAGGGLPVPEFLLLMGDQTYVDATAGLFDARRLDDRHRIAYEAFMGARGARSVLSRLPALMLLDDHEIDNNWEPDPPGAHARKRRKDERRKDDRPGYNESLMKKGVQEFMRNQRDEDCNPAPPPRLWQRTRIAGFEFFLADGRTDRTPRTAATARQARLLGEAQSRDLDDWLADKQAAGPRFCVSGPMVLPRHLALRGAHAAAPLRCDAWDGYPASLHRLLAKVYERGSGDVVFLSGNEHFSNVASFRISRLDAPDSTVVAHSVHSSALYAPYPFANGASQDFGGSEAFEFEYAGVQYVCSVETWYPSRGDGFAVLSVEADDAGWRVRVRFDREEQSPDDPANRTEFLVGPPAGRLPPQRLEAVSAGLSSASPTPTAEHTIEAH